MAYTRASAFDLERCRCLMADHRTPLATLACELIDRRRCRAQAEARIAIFTFLEGWYNPQRRHSALGYLSPIDYERSIQPRA